MRIDWQKLITIMVRKHGGQHRLAAKLTLEGIYTSESTFRTKRRGDNRGSPVRDRAVWLVKDAERRGVEIPYKEDK